MNQILQDNLPFKPCVLSLPMTQCFRKQKSRDHPPCQPSFHIIISETILFCSEVYYCYNILLL